jgi:hypothetical protein
MNRVYEKGTRKSMYVKIRSGEKVIVQQQSAEETFFLVSPL